MRLIVQKFGGTSVATPRQRARLAELVGEAMAKGYHPVVVVSAMGRAGDPYATDTFIQLALQIHPGTAPREMDLLISCGEVIAAVLIANTLRASGIDAMALSGGQAGIITDLNFSDARIIRVDPARSCRSSTFWVTISSPPRHSRSSRASASCAAFGSTLSSAARRWS